MRDSKYILVLPSWYPSRVDAYNGDFIQRHVKAISLFRKQHVIYVVKDLSLIEKEKTEIHTCNNYTEEIIYYRPIVTGISIADKIISHSLYLRLVKKSVKAFLKKNGKPGLVHVHVALKAGMIAKWMKKKWHIPYFVSEHWTGYLKHTENNIYQANSWYKNQLNAVLSQASAISAVSVFLGRAITKFNNNVIPVRIPNVVDTTIFFPALKMQRAPVFLHASTMNYQKNIEDILVAMAIVKETSPSARLHLYGPLPSSVNALITELHLQESVIWKGEVDQEALAGAMRTATALILYSRYETFGCVIIEALATALPVIVSDIPVFHELVSDMENGIIVPLHDTRSLASAMNTALNKNFNIQEHSMDEYNYNNVGKRFEQLYKTVVEDN
ncbi:MAG: glycosyltransferase [Ferruginibacter sp.]